MPNQAIDLSKDLELWCDFAPRYFDNQRNRIQDKSGYGRHPEASGGPTVGVEGPNDFQATSFDGSDDYFDPGINIEDVSSSPYEFTLHFLAKASANEDGAILNNGKFNSGVDFYIRNGTNISLQVNGDGNTTITTPADVGVWYSATARFDGSNLLLEVNGESIGISTGISSYTPNTGRPLTIGRRPESDSAYLNGSVALCGIWTRAISDAETDALHRLTAPRRAML